MFDLQTFQLEHDIDENKYVVALGGDGMSGRFPPIPLWIRQAPSRSIWRTMGLTSTHKSSEVYRLADIWRVIWSWLISLSNIADRLVAVAKPFKDQVIRIELCFLYPY